MASGRPDAMTTGMPGQDRLTWPATRHVEVGDQDIRTGIRLIQHRHGLDAGLRLHHLVAGILKAFGHDLADMALVFDQKDEQTPLFPAWPGD